MENRAPSPAGCAIRDAVVESPGPEPLAAARLPALAQPLRGCCAGPAAVRTALPCPVASNSAPIGVLTGSGATFTRSRCPDDALGWTPSRQPAGATECRREESSGLGYLDSVLVDGESAAG